MKNQIKIYEDLKNNFNKQKTQIKDELNNLFLSGKYEIDFDKNKNKDKIINIKDIKEDKEKIIQIELSNGEIIKIGSEINAKILSTTNEYNTINFSVQKVKKYTKGTIRQ